MKCNVTTYFFIKGNCDLFLQIFIRTWIITWTLLTGAYTIEQKAPRECGIEIDLFGTSDDSKQSPGNKTDETITHDSQESQGETLTIERKRIIGKIDYLPKWSINPDSTVNLLLKAESLLNIDIIDILDPFETNLTQIQKMSVLRQLGEFKTRLESTKPLAVEKPVLSGDYPSRDGKTEIYGKFKTVNENIEQTADFYPLLYMTGFDDFNMPEEKMNILKSYLLRGGMLFADPAGGEKGFSSGFMKLIQRMFPDQEMKELPPDHPVYHLKYNLQQIRYTGSAPPIGNQHRIMGMNIGCKTAIFFSPDTVGCAWDGHMHGTSIEHEMHFEDAIGLGINLIAYALSHRDITLPLPVKIIPDEITTMPNPDLITWYQIKYQGNFDPNPASINFIQEWFLQQMNIPFESGRKFVNLDENLPQYPFMILFGKQGFTPGETGSSHLTSFIRKGSTLLVFSACGDMGFNLEFRQWCESQFKDASLKPLAVTHPLFSSHYLIHTWSYRPQTGKALETYVRNHISPPHQSLWLKNSYPVVEHLSIPETGGQIFFFPFDLLCAWKKEPCLLCNGVSELSPDSYNIMANVFMYLLFPVYSRETP